MKLLIKFAHVNKRYTRMGRQKISSLRAFRAIEQYQDAGLLVPKRTKVNASDATFEEVMSLYVKK